MKCLKPGGSLSADHAVRFRLVPWSADQRRPCGKESISESRSGVAAALAAAGLSGAAEASGGEPPLGGGALAERLAAWRLSGCLARERRNLSIHYLLQGPMDQLELPVNAERSERRDELWRGTCLEFFLAPLGGESYWEFNLSPAGHWNVYRFSGYRSGMVPDPGYTVLPFQVSTASDCLSLDLECALPAPLGSDQPLELGVSAVIVLGGAEPTYWALAHPGVEPDFHRREGFRLLV